MHPTTRLRCSRAAHLLALTASAAALLGPGSAVANGRAQVGASLGLYSTWDLAADSSIIGAGWRDGTVVQTVNVTSNDPRGNIQVFDGVASARVELQVQGQLLQPGGAPGLPVGGLRAVESDLQAGALRLQSRSGDAAYGPPASTRYAYAAGYAFAELFETFELRWAKDHAGPLEVNLRMTLDGVVLQNEGLNGWMAGLGVYLNLGNVTTGVPPGLPYTRVARFETSLAGEVVDVGGELINTQCLAQASYCESWVNVYAGIDLSSRNLATGEIDFLTGAPSDLDFSQTARLALTSSPGVSVLRVDNLGTVLPDHAWVNPTPVPEPGRLALFAVGLLGLMVARARHRPHA